MLNKYLINVITIFKFLLLYFLVLGFLFFIFKIDIVSNILNQELRYAIMFLLLVVEFLLYPFALIFQIYAIYKKKFSLFFIFYFLFFIFYFLFFIFYFLFFIGLIDFFHYFGIMYEMPFEWYLFFISPLFIFIYLYKARNNAVFLKRYLFAFLAAFSDILIKYTITQDFVSVFMGSNKKFYELQLYWIPLTFALIQLSIEAYYFYKKEKTKWDRCKRIKGLKRV